MNGTGGRRVQIVVVADPDISALLARNWWAMALCGLFGILFGIIAFVWPVATMLSLARVRGLPAGRRHLLHCGGSTGGAAARALGPAAGRGG
jgi:hypothetical protein